MNDDTKHFTQNIDKTIPVKENAALYYATSEVRDLDKILTQEFLESFIPDSTLIRNFQSKRSPLLRIVEFSDHSVKR